MSGQLYLVPTSMGDAPLNYILPGKNIEIILSLKHFVVEELRTARRFLKTVDKEIDIDSLNFYVLNKHTSREDISMLLQPLKSGYNVGIMSEAGCPGVADPGADLVALAHQNNIPVIPLVGPSSILLALMASGMNGQNFAFSGYLPVKPTEKLNRLRELEKRIYSENQCQIFIEAPYRNMKLMDDLIRMCPENLRLCVAVDITTKEEFIKTLPVKAWKKVKIDIHKRPAIFILGK